jgi:exosome complex RNA-binding protein Csl4
MKLTTRRPSRLSAAALVVVSGLAAAANAELPAALDRVPTTAAAGIGVRNLEALVASVKNIATLAGVSPDDMLDGPVNQFISMPGVNKTGSLGIVVLAPAAEGEEPTTVAIVPVSDYKAMVEGAGGTPGEAVATITINDRTLYVKNIQGGFAAVGEDQAVVTAFDGKPGNLTAHAKALGVVGSRATEGATAVILANVPELAPLLKNGMADMKDEVGMMAAMNPQAAAMGGQIALIETLMEGFTRDAQSAVAGLNIDKDGNVALDLAAQFKQGSEVGKFFAAPGKASGMLTRVPNLPFLLTFALDTSAPGIKQLFKNADAIAKKAAADAAKENGAEAPAQGAGSPFDPFGSLGEQIESTDGYAVVWGQTPALFGGLFSNSVAFVQSAKPAQVLNQAKTSIDKLNNQTVDGVTFQTAFNPGASEIAGVKVAEWSMKMKMDPNDPMAMQAQQMQAMIFGPAGMSGLMADAGSGVVWTMAKNTPLMTQAIGAAKDGKGLAEDPTVKEVAARLPADRTFEGYLGVKPIIETVSQALAMFGGGMGEMKLPQTVAPVGFGGTTDSGGVQVRLVFPGKTINAVGAAVKESQRGDEGEPAPADDKPRNAPRF